jgi:Putative Flp pilus-assembly TadE/G-like
MKHKKYHDDGYPNDTALPRSRERGAIAIVVGLSLAVLIGAGGLALDLSRLYVNKTELQTAADACALAAAGELICPAGTAGCLAIAASKGLLAASHNTRDFQSAPTTIAAADVRFSTNFIPNSAYQPATAAASGSKFAMCIARHNGITPWLMGVLGAGNSNVVAQAVATLGPGSTICPSAPVGACPSTSGVPYAIGDWIAASHNNGGPNDDNATLDNPGGSYGTNVKGTFRWVDYTPPAGGGAELAAALAGATTCGVSPTSTAPGSAPGTSPGNVGQPGAIQSAKTAYNSRFGIYTGTGGPSAYTVNNAPPDRTGWSYPTRPGGGSSGISVGQSAFPNYIGHYAAADPYQGATGPGGYNVNAVARNGNARPRGDATSASNYSTYGSSRRLVAVPMLNDCSAVGGNKTFTTMGCFLMLNPMSNGNTGDVFMEYRGAANLPGSPCASSGGPGGPGSTAGLVPTLVQ